MLAAKPAVIAVPTFVIALPSCLLAYQIGRVMLSGEGYAPGDPWPALLGVALSISTVGLLGLGAGTILRNSAGAITAVLGIIIVPPLFGSLFGDWERWVVGASPATALQKLSHSSDVAADVAGTLGAWPWLGLLSACIAATLLTGAWLFRTRDV